MNNYLSANHLNDDKVHRSNHLALISRSTHPRHRHTQRTNRPHGTRLYRHLVSDRGGG